MPFSTNNSTKSPFESKRMFVIYYKLCVEFLINVYTNLALVVRKWNLWNKKDRMKRKYEWFLRVVLIACNKNNF